MKLFFATGLLLCLTIVSQICNSLEASSLHCKSKHDVTSISLPLMQNFAVGNDNTSALSSLSDCRAEYQRTTRHRTPGLTTQDLLRSRAWIGNQYRLHKAIHTLNERSRPFVAVVAGGSISLGHGTFPTHRYSERLERWMNELYPLPDDHHQRHQVINVAAHGADICSMAKRLNILYSDLTSRMPPSSQNEPDLILLEFAVNDYQGQDHLITIDHKTSVFFDGFRELVLCAEVVVHSLRNRYPRAAIVFLEVQTAILTRKTGTLLHMGIAQHYEIPVISYAEAMFPDFYRLIKKLETMDGETYSFLDDEWRIDGGIGVDSATVANASQYAAAVLPFPHGCSPCQSQYIIPQFRQGGCKSICTFVDRSGILHDRKLKCNRKQGDIPPGRNECFVPFLAHDAIHPSAMGHAIITDLIVDALASAQLRQCEKEWMPEKEELPLTTFVAESFDELKVRADFLWVHDVDRIFSRWDELKPVAGRTTSGFTRYADDALKQRPGWIATNEKGGESITFPIDLPPGECFTVYVAILRSYKGMGTMQIQVKDYGDKKGDDTSSKLTTSKKVDGLWSSPISVWNDVQITEDNNPGCTGYCEVTIATDPIVPGRDGNKVKVLTVSARRCSRKNFYI
ncbi:hypothetical protein HJC23_010534 [Cyclotella cryptica]|uniref:SGNH hydrolase-type esterase domain-containing protein n=1 Tax=Cyclotella cryptica TaxID=29204 RepID=A0ABD3QAL2_9STRA